MRRFSTILVAAAAVAFPAMLPAARAETPEPRPLLQQLNREVENLYRDVSAGVVRVQLPTPKWVVAEAQRRSVASKWAQDLSPEMLSAVQKQLQQREKGKITPYSAEIVQAPANSPATRPAAPATLPASRPVGPRITHNPDGTTTIEPNGSQITIHAGGDRDANGNIAPASQPTAEAHPVDDFAPNEVGLLLDGQGRLMVPKFIEKQAIPEAGVRVAVNGVQRRAVFVGSDAQTEITILAIDKVDPKTDHPITLSAKLPERGALVMLLSPHDGAGRLIVWTGNVQDYGVIASIDGSVAGIIRNRRFFSARAAKGVVEQLIAAGDVKRPVLGVRLVAVADDDPVRKQTPLLGAQPAVRVAEVAAGSVAARGGLVAGDLILRLGKEPVGDPPTFAAFLTSCAGATPVDVVRNGALKTLTLPLSGQ